jgi:hypothetical protein
VAQQAARPGGISETASQVANQAGAPQVSLFAGRQGRSQQVKQAKPGSQKLPGRRQINLAAAFKPREVEQLYVQLALGQAAARRHLQLSRENPGRDRRYRDPRPPDWASLDLEQYDFLTGQVRPIAFRRNRKAAGYIDTSGLSPRQLSELWAFARFEADRAHRNIDHLQMPGNGIGPPTSDYLAGKHRLEARFYTFLAEQLETIMPPLTLVEAQVAAGGWAEYGV